MLKKKCYCRKDIETGKMTKNKGLELKFAI